MIMQSVHKTFEVLEMIARSPEGISLDSLCKSMNYPKTTLHRIGKCLCSCGYIRQSETGKYFLTSKLVTLGYSLIHHDPLVREAVPFMSELANQTGFTVNLQRRDLDKVLLLTKEEPQNSVFHTNAHAGLASSLLHSACGKVVLSYFPREQQLKYWQTYCDHLDDFQHFCELEINNEHDFFQALAHIRTRGYAVDGEENESGITCIAVPLEKNETATYAISVSGLTPKIHQFGQTQLLDQLRQVADVLVERYL